MAGTSCMLRSSINAGRLQHHTPLTDKSHYLLALSCTGNSVLRDLHTDCADHLLHTVQDLSEVLCIHHLLMLQLPPADCNLTICEPPG